MELLQLKYFCDAAKSENFSKTAAKFYVPASNISQIIKRLEKELGVELFERHYNKITLSDAGKRFYSHISPALSIIEDAANEAASTKQISGDIKMRVLANRRWVTEAIESFIKEYPHVNFIIKHEDDPESDCDLLIAHNGTEGFEKQKAIFVDEVVLAINKKHPLAHMDILTPENLINERFITMPRGRSLYSITFDICAKLGFTPNIAIQTDDPNYVRKYVELGLGIAFIPKYSWNGLFSENVVFKNTIEYKLPTSIYLPKQKKAKAAVSAFTDCLEETISKAIRNF